MKMALLVSTALVGFLAAVPAGAQELTAGSAQTNGATDDQSSETAEIIVTAQKRAERLQDVPRTVDVVTGDAREAEPAQLH